MALLTVACVTATTNVTPFIEMAAENRSVVAGPDDAIVIMPQDGVKCISKSLRQLQPDLRIVPPDEFRRVAFPDEPSDRAHFTYPISEAQRQLVSTQVFRDRVAPLHLRHLVIIDEVERTSDSRFSGGGQRSRSLRLIASIIDLKDAREVGRIVVTAKGETFGGILLVPILIIRTTHGPACQALGETLAPFLTGRFPYSSQRAPQDRKSVV